MKGIALEYVFAIAIVIVVTLVSIGIIIGIIKPELIPEFRVVTDVKYACSEYNNTKITFEDFKTVLYGFLTDQCNNFSSELKQEITLEDIERAVKEVDGKIEVIQLSDCHFLSTNTHSVYTCCGNIFEAGKKINITRREIKNSDVLICGQ
jgi:hypothetical protein